MQTTGLPSFIEATFIKELKNRFLCEVEINGERVVCYVPSSCHLSNFLKLEGKKVLLVPTQTKSSRTQYALFAVPHKRSYILLNTSMANRAIEYNIQSRRFSYLGKRKTILKERYIDGYKSDLYIKDTSTIVEIKSVLSPTQNAIFPTVYSERSIVQLGKIKRLLSNGYKACYIIVSLNPYVKTVEILKGTMFSNELQRCLELGLSLYAYSCKFDGYHLSLIRELPIVMEGTHNG